VVTDESILSPPGNLSVDEFYKKLIDIKDIASALGQFFI